MKKASARISSLITLALYASIITGVSSYFSFFHKASFQQIIKTSDHDELTVLHLTSKEFSALEWEDQGKEFEYQGKMYDVAKVETTPTGYLIHCENDVLEDLFLNWMKSETKSKSNGMAQVQFCSPVIKCCFTFELASTKFFHYDDAIYSSIIPESVTPPPRNC